MTAKIKIDMTNTGKYPDRDGAQRIVIQNTPTSDAVIYIYELYNI